MTNQNVIEEASFELEEKRKYSILNYSPQFLGGLSIYHQDIWLSKKFIGGLSLDRNTEFKEKIIEEAFHLLLHISN